MKIKVCETNKNRIENLLKEVNGNRISFPITHFDEIYEICLNAERKMYQSGLIESQKQGAEIRVVSGGSVAKRRTCTELRLYRGKKAWFLVAAYLAVLLPNESGYVNLFVNDNQNKLLLTSFLHRSTISKVSINTY